MQSQEQASKGYQLQVGGDISGGSTVKNGSYDINIIVNSASPNTSAPAATEPQPRKRKPGHFATTKCSLREVMEAYKQLPTDLQSAVSAFSQREFDTRIFKELDDEERHRVRQYARSLQEKNKTPSHAKSSALENQHGNAHEKLLRSIVVPLVATALTTLGWMLWWPLSLGGAWGLMVAMVDNRLPKKKLLPLVCLLTLVIGIVGFLTNAVGVALISFVFYVTLVLNIK
jgi:hypothetical protein